MPNTRNQPQGDLLTAEKERIRYGKCIGCPDLGPRCGAGNLLNLPIDELRAWIRLWRMFWGLSIEQCAAIWDTPFGTTARVLSEADSDFKYSTMHHIVYRIVNYGIPSGQEISDNPCPATSSEISSQIDNWRKLVDEKEQECERLRKKNTEKDEQYIAQMALQRQNHIEEREVRERSITFLRDLAEKRQRDLEKEESQSKDYLARIDEKNDLLDRRREEVRLLNEKIIELQTQRVSDLEQANSQLEALRADHRKDRKAARMKFTIAVIALAAVSALLLCYLVWDIAHPGAGFFLY